MRLFPDVVYEHACYWGLALQRFFSMFPNGLPGAGLLLLRSVRSVLIIAGGVTTIIDQPHNQILLLQSIAGAAALLLLVGFWTPIAGSLIVVAEVCFALSSTNSIELSVLLATVGAALAALGRVLIPSTQSFMAGSALTLETIRDASLPLERVDRAYPLRGISLSPH